ncbi:MAG: hypothetical protein JNK87_05665 [Bryobacterales bacterium]|nr:hypothetical protein [Bryobacterales bacterium]
MDHSFPPLVGRESDQPPQKRGWIATASGTPTLPSRSSDGGLKWTEPVCQAESGRRERERMTVRLSETRGARGREKVLPEGPAASSRRNRL